MEPAKFTRLKTEAATPATGLLTLTERAAEEIKAALAQDKEPFAGLRLGVETGGHGVQYFLAFAKAPESDDVVVESQGIKVFVKSSDQETLRGAKVGYIDTPQGSGFHVENPNVQATGGCGCAHGGCGCGSGGCGCSE